MMIETGPNERRRGVNMLSEAGTLYKLMIMYMLKKVNFPLTNSQMTEFFLEKGYTNYFTFQTAVNELVEANLVTEETIGTRTRYELTSEGEEALGFFNYKISDTIKAEIDDFIRENKYKMRSEIAITAIYDRTNGGDYTATMTVREGKSTLIEMNLSFPTEEEAKNACAKWEGESQEIYEFIVMHLLG